MKGGWNMTEAAIGLGLVLSLIFSEFFGLAAGGMVVPGYVAMHLDEPLRLTVTVTAGLLTWQLLRLFSFFTFIYGRRRVVVTLIVGFVLARFCTNVATLLQAQQPYGLLGSPEVQAIGLIVPGLLAHWMERQGALRTLTVMGTCAVLVKLVLMLVYPEAGA